MLSLRKKRPTTGDTPTQSGVISGAAEAATGRMVLQRLTLPDPAISDQTRIFVGLDAATAANNSVNNATNNATDSATEKIHFRPGGTATFDTYMTLFNLGTWAGQCHLEGLRLELRGTGQFALNIHHVLSEDETHTLHDGPITLTAGGVDLDIAALIAQAGTAPDQGLITFQLTATDVGVLTGGGYTAALPANTPAAPLKLAISITTFRREDDVARTVARICAFLQGPGADLLGAMGAQAHLFVVDNGQSLRLPDHPNLTLIPNRNLGGAGGFARGLAAAQDGGFSHCLFMDDDASFQMENFVRTVAFLRLARSPRAAVAGAMISAGKPWAMWENGAVFDRTCRPQFTGTDLRDAGEVAEMELAASQPKPAGFYGGWWYFAFPLDQVTHYPFPFFVRGDDISFSLAHRFDTVTLPGVVSFQEDFSAKESPQTLYLDLRNHLHQHLVHEGMEIGGMGTGRIALWFIARSLVRMHYDSAEAQLTSWQDVMKGPAFFAENVDMSAKRPQIGALIRTEAWQPITGKVPKPETYEEPRPLMTKLLKATLNGHLVPGWRVLGRDRAIPISDRGLIWPIWGLRSATFVDAEAGRSYTVQHSKARFYTLGLRALWLMLRWNRAYSALQQAHQHSYDDMASRPFWQARFLPEGGGAHTATDPSARAAE